MEIYFYLALTLCAMGGFHIGLRWFSNSNAPLYARMIVFGVGCAMLGRLFETLELLVSGEIQAGFHVGLLGILGNFLFFLAANYGTMDSLVDDKSSEYRKYRLIALSAPAVILALYGLFVYLVGFGWEAGVNGVITLVIMQASYYNMKHLIIPDVEGGLIRGIRGYNLLALILAVLCMLEMIVNTVNVTPVLRYGVYVLLCCVYFLLVPVMEKGVKKWTT